MRKTKTALSSRSLRMRRCASAMRMMANSVRGIGHSLAPALITLFGSCILRVIYISAMLNRFTDFRQVVVIYPITWTVTGSAVILLYFLVTRREYRGAKETA